MSDNPHTARLRQLAGWIYRNKDCLIDHEEILAAAARIEALEAALRKISITIHRDYDETPVLVRLKNIADAALAPEQDK